MANNFEKPTIINRTAIGLLLREIVLPGVVWTNGIGDFAGAFNDTINLRIPARATARKRALRGTGSDRNITLDTLTEQVVAVQLTEDVYSAVPLTDEELTLDIFDIGDQVLTPQIRAVGEQLEDDIAAMIQGAAYQTVVRTGTGDGATWDAYINARKALNVANVPMANRILIGGPGWEAALLKDPQFARFDHSGDQNNTALRDAMIGQIGGTTFVTSNALREGEAYLAHKSAYVFANRAPNVPQGAAFGNSQSMQNLAMRWIRDYDPTTLTDRSVINSFAGYQAISDPVDGFVRGVQLLLPVISIEVLPSTAAIVGTATHQLKAYDSNGFDVTTAATWTSATTSKATVGASTGLVTGVAAGTSVVTATYTPPGGSALTSTCLVTVS
ncbi:Ig-like domain-containing protein [Nocardia sp. NBC_00511]|uniref:Ig-like domain-containing protein n=1 Tax=Nocardia sp. NBC_00511 TaxID=2903591 RepID=UPI0030E58C99